MTTLAEHRAAALELYDEAKTAVNPDWKVIADMLAELMPRSKVKPTNTAGLEWCEYTARQHHGKGNAFRAQCYAVFVFADLTMVEAPLRWRKSKNLPDWARASRMAVHFYRARMGFAKCAVPAIIQAHDPDRNIYADHAKASEITMSLRNGHVIPMPGRFSSAHLHAMALDEMRRSITIKLPKAA